jgi:hypothetical protein
MDLLVNIDVSDLTSAIAYYRDAPNLVVTRRLGVDEVELEDWPVKVQVLRLTT